MTTSVRVDQSGAREEIALVGRKTERMFVCTHIPAGRPTAALIICPPVYAEFLHNYRKEVILARTLAAAGVAVQRFHYRGSGNSDGDAATLTFESMLADSISAVGMLREKADVGICAFLGTRLGAVVASAAVAGVDDAPLAVWQPVLDPDAYFQEVFRTAAIGELTRHSRRDGSSHGAKASVEELESAGSVDVLGHSIHRDLYRSFVGHHFPDELGPKCRDVLFLQIDRRDLLGTESLAAITSLRSTGCNVDARAIRADDHWWLSGNPRHSTATLRAVVAATTGWLNDRFK